MHHKIAQESQHVKPQPLRVTLRDPSCNRHTDFPHTANAERSRTHSVDVAGELAKLDSDGYRPLRTAAGAEVVQ